jgi:DNA polymerase III subunit gamma/tau
MSYNESSNAKSKGTDLSEQALYRKYRSATFDAVIGQSQIVATLRNAIASDRLSHAYLFTGPRGVGKTSVARLLARAANCTAENPANRPCGVCENCQIEIGGHLDLIEIDAASNRGIDDARALREKITSAPSMGRYKVYIIDEVHMLTTEAFNALLKTLEEPPPHALFILATTEAHKLPETIISRTQRFSFKPIAVDDIVAHLETIAKKESVRIDKAAITLLAHASRGGFRDAISMFDQAATSGVTPLTEVAVRELLGQSDPALLEKITTATRDHQPAAALGAIDEALKQGVQAGQLANQLMEYWRSELQTLVRDRPEDVSAIRHTITAIETILPVLKSSWPELSLEAGIVRLATGQTAAGATAAMPGRRPVAARVAATASDTTEPTQPVGDQAPDKDLWLKALAQIKQRNNSLYALLRSAASVRFEGDQLILGCRFSFHRDRLKEAKNLQIIEQALVRVYGRKLRVMPQLETKPAPVATSDSSAELMTSALEILGGEVVHE